MPIYVYTCTEKPKKHVFERIAKYDQVEVPCETCGAPARRAEVNKVGVQFNAAGFTRTSIT